jgi:hypothetical protein
MSAFEGTWLDFALRDCGINAFIIVGVATEIESSRRSAMELTSVIFPCLSLTLVAAGNEEAAKRSIESLKFAGDALITDTETIWVVSKSI